MVVEAVSPLKATDDVAKVTVGPSSVCPAGPMAESPEALPQARPVLVTLPAVSI